MFFRLALNGNNLFENKCPMKKAGITSLPDLVKWFSAGYCTRRLGPDYFSGGQYADELIAALTELGKTRPFRSP
jgi:hypothetical protein